MINLVILCSVLKGLHVTFASHSMHYTNKIYGLALRVCLVPGGVLEEKLGRGVRPASQNPYPIYDQNLRFSLPYL